MEILTLLLLAGAVTLTESKGSRSLYDEKSCNGCISFGSNTEWCAELVGLMKMPGKEPRCQPRSSHARNNLCAVADIVSPDENNIVIRKKKPVKPRRPISPRRVHLTLRKDATATIPIEVFAGKENVTVTFRYPRAVKVEVKSYCKGFKWMEKTATCTGLSSRKMQFNVTVTMRRCLPKAKKIKATVNGHKKKSLRILLNSRCNCDCENNAIHNSSHCSGHGTLTCGVCKCNPGYHGFACECHRSMMTEEQSIAKCKPRTHQDLFTNRASFVRNGSPCYGAGMCSCGMCICDSRLSYGTHFSGQYCDKKICDDYTCPEFDGMNCGGVNRGTCTCNKCVCEPGYEGEACERTTCKGSTSWNPNLTHCSGHGNLTCGVCWCNRGYHGINCECDGSIISEEQSMAKCTPPNGSPCSARGVCSCGVCTCDSRMSYGTHFKGQYCTEKKCDDYTCPLFNNLNCGGVRRGTCTCNKCVCKPGYEGRACELITHRSEIRV